MLSATASIQRYVAGRTYDEYLDDEMLQSAVERQFIIIGEALRALGVADPDMLTRVSDARSIIGFRNVLVHGYGELVPPVVWDAIDVGLPTLRAEVEALLSED